MSGYRDTEAEKRRPAFMEGYRKLGPTKFWSIMIGLLAWIAIGLWLKSKLSFPESYGFTCYGKGCLYVEVWHSFALLHRPSGYEFSLFVWLWSWPIALVAAVIYAVYRQLNPTNNSDAE